MITRLIEFQTFWFEHVFSESMKYIGIENYIASITIAILVLSVIIWTLHQKDTIKWSEFWDKVIVPWFFVSIAMCILGMIVFSVFPLIIFALVTFGIMFGLVFLIRYLQKSFKIRSTKEQTNE